MASEPFVWEPDQNQTYTTANGDTRLETGFGQYDKSCGASFIMQAPGKKLELLSQVSLEESTSFWGGSCAALPATILVQDGSLYLAEQEKEVSLQIAATDLILQNSGYFRGYLHKYSSSGGVFPNRINLTDASGLELHCDELYWNAGDLIQILDMSSMKVTGPAINIQDSQIAVSSQLAREDASLELHVLESIMEDPILIRNTAFSCSGTSKTVIRVAANAKLTIYDSVFSVTDDARIELYGNDYDFYGGTDTSFRVNAGSNAIIFSPVTAGKAPFDFVNRSYPPGLFRFEASIPDNPAMFLLRNCGSAFEFNAMLAQGLIWVADGGPQNDRIDHQLVDGDLIITLKY